MKSIICILFTVLLASCASASKATNPDSPALDKASNDSALYYEIGGKATLDKIFGLAIARIYNDPVIGRYFDKVPKRHLRMHLVDQVCVLINGPCTYTGKSMKESHQGLSITESEFYILVEYVRGAMEDIGLTPQQENLILQKLAPLKSQIVGL